MLTPQQAIEIYNIKLNWASQNGERITEVRMRIGMRGISVPIAKQFGVSARAIRDIWNRRAWGHTTFSLWDQEAAFIGIDEPSSDPVSLKLKRLPIIQF